MKFKNILTGAGFTALLAVTACTKQIDDAFQNPNAPVRVPVVQLLPGIIGNMTASSNPYGPIVDGILIGRYVQNFGTNTSGGQYDQMGGAIGGSDQLGGMWAAHYYGQGENLNKMIEWSLEENKLDFAGVGHAIRAWAWLTTTNIYGEIIVKEAFNRDQLVFNFDEQEVAYMAARSHARQAIELLNKAGQGSAELAAGDAFMNKGNLDRWKKFAYGVLARSFNQLSNKASYNADSVIYFCNLAAQANADNTIAYYANTGVTGTMNFFGPTRSNVGAMRQSAFIANLLTGQNTVRFKNVTDPRRAYLLQENNAGGYTGITPARGYGTLTNVNRPRGFWGQGYNAAFTVDSTVAANDLRARYVFRNGAPMPILTAAEIQFIKAEALYRKNDKAGALAAYSQGISLNIDHLTNDYPNAIPADRIITPATKSAYLASTEIVPVAAELTLSHIMLQKYIALFGYGIIETWTDMRRYHYTDAEAGASYQVYADFTPPTGSDLYINNKGKLVYRSRPRYNSEYLYNVAELQRLGALELDYHTKEMWYSTR